MCAPWQPLEGVRPCDRATVRPCVSLVDRYTPTVLIRCSAMLCCVMLCYAMLCFVMLRKRRRTRCRAKKES